MRRTCQRLADIMAQRADIRSPPARHAQQAPIARRPGQRVDAHNFDRPRRNIRRLALARQLVERLTALLEGGIDGRPLHDRAGKLRQNSLNGGETGDTPPRFDHRALRVLRIGSSAEGDFGQIGFLLFHQKIK